MNLLCELLRDPTVARTWDVAQWNRFLPLARNARLMGRCLYLFREQGPRATAPQRVLDLLAGALAQTRYIQGQALRELRHVARCLAAEQIPLLALKGVAYQVAGLPPAQWRNLSDIDLLVAEADIVRAEQALKRAGWGPSGAFDAYDQHYYRDWMHEVPPLVHRSRQVEVDLHHNLAPPVSRVRIEAARLWAQAQPIELGCGLRLGVLDPADMLLHNAVHLFMNDELRGGLRDVVDFRDLFVHFRGADDGFEDTLLARADAHGAGRALYYAVDSACRLAGLEVSAVFAAALRRHAPPFPARQIMAWLIDQALAPQRLGLRRTTLAQQLLFIRSHWIRMPPGMLLRHLLHKAFKRRHDKGTADVPEMPG